MAQEVENNYLMLKGITKYIPLFNSQKAYFIEGSKFPVINYLQLYNYHWLDEYSNTHEIKFKSSLSLTFLKSKKGK